MTNSQTEKISAYLSTNSRNKIVFYDEGINVNNSINIGQLLADKIQGIKPNKHFTLKVNDKLNQILDESIFNHPEYGATVAIHNLGILFENDLKIDFLKLIEEHSKNNCLFINWEGNYEQGKLFFLNENTGIEINIDHLSHITI